MGSVRVNIEYCNVCNFQSQCEELKETIQKLCPDAAVVCQAGRRGSFEVQINDTLVHSKLSSLAFPNYGDVVANVHKASQGEPVNKVEQQPITDCVIQ